MLGFAETATALGHCVAEALGGADYLHSTRRPVAGVATAGAFVEEHSHATGHLLLPSDPALLAGPRPLVLVDDELSTGRTALNTITALHRAAPRAHYVVATLVDLREDELAGLPDGVRVDVVALTRGGLTLPPDLAERAAALRAELAGRDRCRPTGAAGARQPPVRVLRHAPLRSSPARPTRASMPSARRQHEPCAPHAGCSWATSAGPPGCPRARGTASPPPHHRAARPPRSPGSPPTSPGAADVRAGERTLVLGTEELMAAPLRLAVALADAGHDVRFSTTTRSPAVVVDEPDYALASGHHLPAHDDPADGPGPRFAYNVGPAPGTTCSSWSTRPPTPPRCAPASSPRCAPHTRRTTLVVTP